MAANYDAENYLGNPFINADNDFLYIIKNSNSPASLKNFALARISISLWLQDDIRTEIANSCKFYNPIELKNYLYKYRDKWLEIENKVVGYITKLEVGQSCTEALKETINMVGDQILFFLYYRLCSDAKKIHIYFDNLCWTSQGIINKVETTLLLLEHNGLSTLEKYELACSICSEEKIHYYLAKLPDKFINEFTEVRKLRLMVYWTLHLRGEHKRFYEIRKQEFKFGSSDIKYILEWSFDAKNEIAVQYFMEKCPDEEKRDYLMYCIKTAIMEKSTLIPYLLLHLDLMQIPVFCAGDGYALINRFASDWRLRSYFVPTAKFVVQRINSMELVNALKTILLCWNENIIEEQQCKDYLHEFILHVRGDNEPKFTTICHIVLNSLFALEVVETIRLLLRRGSSSVRNQIIYSTFGLKECSNLILKGKFKYLEIFIKEMLGTKVEITKFKSSFFSSKSLEICCSLIVLGKYEILDQFFDSFCTKEEINSYKLELPYKNQGAIISNILKSSTYMSSNQLKAIDEFLYWCFDGVVTKMSDCKTEIFEKDLQYKKLQEQFLQQIFELIIKDELKLGNTYLNWAFRTNERILKFKNHFFEKRSFEICCYLIIHQKYELLDEFLNMFCAKDEISTFKYSLPVGKQGKIIKEILNTSTTENSKELIVKFLNYCFEENEKIITYMKEMIIDQSKDVDSDCREIFLEKVSMLMKAGEWQLLDKYMKWAFSLEDQPFADVEEEPRSECETKPVEIKKSGREPNRFLRLDRGRSDRMFLDRNRMMHNYFSRRTLRRHRPTQ